MNFKIAVLVLIYLCRFFTGAAAETKLHKKIAHVELCWVCSILSHIPVLYIRWLFLAWLLRLPLILYLDASRSSRNIKYFSSRFPHFSFKLLWLCFYFFHCQILICFVFLQKWLSLFMFYQLSDLFLHVLILSLFLKLVLCFCLCVHFLYL